jgi:hypothetical protein
MSPNDIKRIVNCVVDYSWPWQSYDAGRQNIQDDGWSMPRSDLNGLLSELQSFPCRLDPNHEWDWPVEAREGMPCWVRFV